MIEQYRTALTKKDTAALERIWADDYTFINASGTVVTKAQSASANLKSGATSLDTIVTDPDMKIRVYGGDVAVAINRVTLKGRCIAAKPPAANSKPASSGQKRRPAGNWSATRLLPVTPLDACGGGRFEVGEHTRLLSSQGRLYGAGGACNASPARPSAPSLQEDSAAPLISRHDLYPNGEVLGSGERCNKQFAAFRLEAEVRAWPQRVFDRTGLHGATYRFHGHDSKNSILAGIWLGRAGVGGGFAGF